MKAKIIYFFLFLSLTISAANGQQHQGNRKFNIEEFKKKRNEFIKKETGLTDKEAEAFFPLSDELMKKKYEINKELRDNIRELKNKKEKTDADYDAIVQKTLDARIKEANLEKEYYKKFKNVLSSEKIFKYQSAEMKFNRHVINNRERGENREKGRRNNTN